MKLRTFFAFFILWHGGLLFAFNYDDMWKETQRYENSYMSIDVPSSWQSLFKTKGIEKVYNATGKEGLPSVYNGGKVLASVFIWRQESKTDDDVVRDLLNTKAKGANAMYIEPSHGGILMTTFFSRYMNGFSATRYDYMVYVPDLGQYYVVSFLFQYVLGNDNFVESNGVLDYVNALLGHFSLK